MEDMSEDEQRKIKVHKCANAVFEFTEKMHAQEHFLPLENSLIKRWKSLSNALRAYAVAHDLDELIFINCFLQKASMDLYFEKYKEKEKK